MKKYITILIVCLLFTQVAIGGTITTAVKNGSTLELTGTFEADVSPGPLAYEDFEAGDAGRQDGDVLHGKSCNGVGSWLDATLDHIPTYEEDSARTGSTLSGYYPMDSADVNANHSPGWIRFAESHQPTLMISLWINFTWNPAWEVFGNSKIYRITDGVSDEDLNTSLQSGSGNNDPNKGLFGLFMPSGSKNWPSATGTPNVLNFTYINNGVWSHHIIMLKASDNGVENGSAIIWIDGTKLEDTDVMETWGAGASWQSFTAGWYVANYTTANSYIYLDDIYIDNTWRSVYLCNNANWPDATERELQITTLRTTGIIETDYNTGAFTTEDVYAIEIDSNGIPSNGVLVTDAAPSTPSTALNTGTLKQISNTGTIWRAGN